MADKTIGELPSLNTMEADTLIPVEHDGAAKSMSGTVLQNYIYSNVEDDVEVIAAQIATGPKGDDGVSPTVSTTKQNGVATVTITDADGNHTFTVNDGDVSKEFISSSSASGAIANFWRPAGGIPVNSLICDINPVQAGSGDPSPSNVRTISGRTEANIYTAGKNLFNVDAVAPLTDGTTVSVDGSDLTIVANGTSTTYQGVGYGTRNNLIYPAGTYSIKATIVSNSNTAIWSAIGFRTGSNSFASGSTRPLSTTGTFSWTATINEPCFFSIVVNSTEANRAATVVLRDIIISREETDYTSYIGSTYPISLGRTVYGGKLNVTTGKLTVTHSVATFNGSESWGGPDGSGNIYLALSVTGKMTDRASGELTSQLKFNLLGSGGKTVGEGFVSTGGYLNCKPTGISTAADWKTLLGTTNLQVLYPFSEPVVYQLTPQVEVASLLGENNIWANCGNVEVNFGEDIKDYLDKKGTGIPAAEKGRPEGVATLDDYGVLSGLQSSSRLQRFEHDTTLSSEHNGVFGVCQANNITITVPASLPDERFELTLFRWQNYTVTITPASGITINGSSNSKTITTVCGAVLLKKLTETVWIILGDYS